MGAGSDDPTAFVFAVRAGLDVQARVTVSGVFVGVPGPAAGYASGSQAGLVDPSGMQAWEGLLEVRAHTRGTLQLHLAGALGAGRLLNWPCAGCTENDILHGHAAVALQASTGVRFLPVTARRLCRSQRMHHSATGSGPARLRSQPTFSSQVRGETTGADDAHGSVCGASAPCSMRLSRT